MLDLGVFSGSVRTEPNQPNFFHIFAQFGLNPIQPV